MQKHIAQTYAQSTTIVHDSRTTCRNLSSSSTYADGSRALVATELRRLATAQNLPPKAELARNAFMLSFCLCGVNICDLYTMHPPKNNILQYERQKTKDRREDNALQYLRINPIAAQYAAPFIAADGVAWLDWQKRARTEKNMLKTINQGLKICAKLLDLPPSPSTYYARHTFATIARNDLHIDIFDISECLNHTPPSNAIDFVYIRKDPFKASDIADRVIRYALGDSSADAAPSAPDTTRQRTA